MDREERDKRVILDRAFELMEDALELLDSARATLPAAKLDEALEAVRSHDSVPRIRRTDSGGHTLN